MAQQCIEVLFSLEDLGCSREEWEFLSLRLLPPHSTDFNETVLSETLSSGDRRLSAASLLFAAEFERYMGHDSRILNHLFKAAEFLPDNIVTLRALVDELEAFYRPADALPFAERLARVARQQQLANPTRQLETEQWMLGKIRYLAGDKAGAIEHWRTLPFYQRSSGEEMLMLYIAGCERRLRQYEQHQPSTPNSP